MEKIINNAKSISSLLAYFFMVSYLCFERQEIKKFKQKILKHPAYRFFYLAQTILYKQHACNGTFNTHIIQANFLTEANLQIPNKNPAFRAGFYNKMIKINSYYAFTLPFILAITSSAIPDGAGV